MLFCPKCGTRNRTTYNFCYRCGTKIKYSIEDISTINKEITEFKINEFLALKLEKGKTVIYVKDKKFIQCKYLLIEIPKDKLEDFENIASIDDVSDKLDHSLERDINFIHLKPEIEFWGHCSNLQAWSENSYDTCLLHSNLAFPLLKKLTDVGDPTARRVFKDEIAERFISGNRNVAQYLIRENYLTYFNREETELLMEIYFEQIEKKFKRNYSLILDVLEIEALLNIVKVNLIHSQTFLTHPLNPVDIINKDTHKGFSHEKNKIVALGLNRCGLKLLPSSIGNFEHLQEFYLTENRLKALPKSIGNLKNLKKLDLSDNHLTKLPSEIGNLLNLKEMILNHNVIQFLPESISILKNLEILSMWGNQLRILPKRINQMDSLKILGLSFNQLEEFPDLKSGFQNLEILDLSNNKIKTIPEDIHNLKSIRTLWLNNNPLNSIPESLFDLQFLTDLYIINTPLTLRKDKEIENICLHLEERGVNIWK